MDKTFVCSCNLALALCLGPAGGEVLAKGPGAQALQDPAALRFDCTSASQTTTTIAKSTQSTFSHACAPAGPGTSHAIEAIGGLRGSATTERTNGTVLAAPSHPTNNGITGVMIRRARNIGTVGLENTR